MSDLARNRLTSEGYCLSLEGVGCPGVPGLCWLLGQFLAGTSSPHPHLQML